MAEWYPFFQALGLVFFSLQREEKKVLEQLAIETNSKIKIKHLWDKVNPWKKWNLTWTNMIHMPFSSTLTYTLNQVSHRV